MKITDELQEIMDKYNYESIEEIDWYYICQYKKLSEDFIENYFIDKLDLYYIYKYQKLFKNKN